MINAALVRKRLQLNEDQEDLLDNLIEEVIAQWELVTCRKWRYATEVQKFHVEPNRETTLFLQRYPVESVTSVTVKWDGETEHSAFEADEYELINDRRLVLTNELWWPQDVIVTYVGGYTETTLPADVRLSIIQQIEFVHSRNSAGRSILEGQNFRGGAGALQENWLHPSVKIMAERYRDKVYSI